MHRGADGGGTVEHDGEVDRGGDRGVQLWQRSVNSIDRVDDVRARLAKDDDQDGRLAVDHPCRANIFDRVAHPCDIGKLDHGAVVVANDQRLVVLGLEQLVGRADPPGLILVGHLALGPVGVGGSQDGSHVFEADAEVGHLGWIQFDANAGQRAAADRDLADAVYLREFLLEDRIRRVVHQARSYGVRSERENHDRRVGRIDLFVGGLARQSRRQLPGCGVDRGLHVARSGVDIAIQVELQNDAGGAQVTGRSQLGQPRDTAELALERSCHRRSHRLRTRAGQGRLHLDGRELDLRQRRNRQQPKRDSAGQREREGQQCGCDRLPYENFRDAHDA